MKSLKKFGLAVFTAAIIFASCDNGTKTTTPEHVHEFSNYWSSDENYHYHKCVGCNEVKDKSEHKWVEEMTKKPTSFGEGTITIKCSVCEKKTTKSVTCEDVLNEYLEKTGEYKDITDTYTSYCAPESGEWKYVQFGCYPQTILSDESVTIDTDFYANGYFYGSDGNWYSTAYIDPDSISDPYKYSDGTNVTKGETRYFKVEPIVWRVLKEENGKQLLLAENEIFQGTRFYPFMPDRKFTVDGEEKTIQANNYEYSQIRAWLNGLSYYEQAGNTGEPYADTSFEGKGFLQKFTESQQEKIITTTVENNSNTQDKIFLLSATEASMSEYGFAADNAKCTARIRKPTDFAKTYKLTLSSDACKWWLRSPSTTRYRAQAIWFDGKISDWPVAQSDQTNCYLGVIPAIWIEK